MQLWRGQQQETDYVEAERGWEIAEARIWAVQNNYPG